MKKLLLSLAVAALAIPSVSAVTIDDLLGTYTGTYKGWDPQDNWTEYDGVYTDVIIEAGDYDDEVIIKHLFPKKFPELNVVAIFDGYSLYIEEQYLDDDYTYYLTTYNNETKTFVVPVIFTLGDGTIDLPGIYDIYVVPASNVDSYLDNIGLIKLQKEESGEPDGPEDPDDNGGVDGIISDYNTPVYYDLQGRKVENPSNGIFVRKQGKETIKVILK